ncbi:MAG: MFS transporter [Anaerolineae bacterium]
MTLHQARIALRTRLRWLDPRQLSFENRNILFFTIDTALQGLMMGGIFSFLSVFVVRLGASELQTSLVTSLPAIVMVLASIPAGRLVQRQRNLVRFTNWVRVFHRGAILLVALLPFFTQRHLIGLIIAIWTVKAISNVLLESSWMAVVAEIIPAHRRAQVNGMRWTIVSIVTAGAVAIFGYMLDRLPFPLNYQIVFLVSFVGGSLGMVFWGKLRTADQARPEPNARPTRNLRQQIRAYWRSLRVPAFVRYELTTAVFRLGFNMPTALYSIYWIRELKASDLWIGWHATANQLALILGYAVWGKIISRKGYSGPLLICTLGMGLYPLLNTLIPSQVWLPVISIVQGFFITGVNLAFFDTLLGVCPEDRRPSFIAVNTMLASFAIFIAPLLGSFVARLTNLRAVFFIASGIHLVAALLFWLLKTAEAELELGVPAGSPKADS